MHHAEIVIRRALTRTCVVLLGLVGCGEVPVDDIRFAQPERVTVSVGDSLQDVAAAHGVSAEDLMMWNGLTDDRVEEERTLFVWPVAEPAPAEAVAVADAEEVAPSTRPAPAPRRASSRPSPRRSPSNAKKIMVVEPTVVASPEAAKVEVERPASVRSSGVLGVLSSMDGGLSEGLADKVANLSAKGKSPGTAGLSGRKGNNLGGGGTAEELGDIGRKPRTKVGPQIGDGAVRAPKLRMPAAKRCLSGPSAADLKSDDGYIASQSLTPDQIRRTMSSFVRKTMSCIPSGTKGTYEIETQINVGCDGRVRNVWIIDRGVLPENVADCIAETLRYASFPAHALPDGVTFEYPIQYRY